MSFLERRTSFAFYNETVIKINNFKMNNIIPEWIWIRRTDKGLLNETTGQWSGGVGNIQRDEADYAVKKYIPSYTMSQVVAFSPL